MSIIKSFSVGNGDMFCIQHNGDSFTTIDCCCNGEIGDQIISEIKEMKKGKTIDRFISTHPDEDHIGGINKFVTEIGISNFYCVNNKAVKVDETDSFKAYKLLHDSDKTYYVKKGIKRKWLNENDVERGSSGIQFLWPDIDNIDFMSVLDNVKEGYDYNNLSPIFTYSLENGVKAMWMGDIEHNFLEKVKNSIVWEKVNIIFAPHHGRRSGRIPTEVLKKINPYVIVIGEADSEEIYYYSDFNTITQKSAGDIIFDCKFGRVDIFVSKSSYEAHFELDFHMDVNHRLGHYIGSFNT